jgi:hypothetical protein
MITKHRFGSPSWGYPPGTVGATVAPPFEEVIPVPGLLVTLLVLWLLLAVVGFAVKGLFWLVVVAAVLFLITSIGGARTSRRT